MSVIMANLSVASTSEGSIRDHRDRPRDADLAPGAHAADKESEQHRDLGRGPDMPLLRGYLIRRYNQSSDRQKHQPDDPGKSGLFARIHRGRTEQRHHRKGSDTRKGPLLAPGALPLQSDQHAQPEGRSELPCGL